MKVEQNNHADYSYPVLRNKMCIGLQKNYVGLFFSNNFSFSASIMKMNLTLGRTTQKYVLWSFSVSHYHETSAPFMSLSWTEGMQRTVNSLTYFIQTTIKKPQSYRNSFQGLKGSTWNWNFRLFPLLQKWTSSASREHFSSCTAVMGKNNSILQNSFSLSQRQ